MGNTSIIRIISVLFSSTVRFNSLTNFLTTLFLVCMILSSGLNSCPLGTSLFSPLWFCSFPTEVISETGSLGSLSVNERGFWSFFFCFFFFFKHLTVIWEMKLHRYEVSTAANAVFKNADLIVTSLCDKRCWQVLGNKNLTGWSGERKSLYGLRYIEALRVSAQGG